MSLQCMREPATAERGYQFGLAAEATLRQSRLRTQIRDRVG